MKKRMKWVSVLCALALLLGCFAVPAAAEAPEGAGQTAENAYGGLMFRIEGPDARMPMEVSYEEFTGGSFTLKGLKPGVYTITEIDPESLLEGYGLQKDSVTAVTVTVTKNGVIEAQLFNHYTPEEEEPEPEPGPGKEEPGEEPEEYTSVSVRKEWDDDGNAMGLRPASVTVTLSNGSTYVLSEANGWSLTVDHLPAKIGGSPAVYTWTEREVPGYTLVYNLTSGNHTTLVNRAWKQPETPEGQPEPKRAGTTWYIFEEYETALGVEIMINHVGDCYE